VKFLIVVMLSACSDPPKVEIRGAPPDAVCSWNEHIHQNRGVCTAGGHQYACTYGHADGHVLIQCAPRDFPTIRLGRER
jgi:hypothetical protein